MIASNTSAAQVGLLYQPGNQVRIEGELDCVLVERQGRSDEEAAALERVRQQWVETRQQVRADARLLRENPRAEEQAYGRYLGQLRRLSDTPRWRVLAGHIEPLGAAEQISQSQARRLRQQWSRERDRGRPPAEAPAEDVTEPSTSESSDDASASGELA